MRAEDLVERFRKVVADDRKLGHVRSLESYQRLFHGHEELIAREYPRVVDDPPTPPAPVDPPSSTDSIVERLPVADSGLRPDGEIARGGMGAIERVRDEALHRDLARKVMLPERESDALYVHRFLEEAQVTAQLDHPGVVPVHQLGRDADGRLFFTMKLIKGRTLSRIFDLVRARRENWTNTRAVELFIRICETLAFAHQKGVVHRDLKPANIMVGSFGELYVMDWGLAKVVGERAEPAGSKTPTTEPPSYVRTVRTGDTTDGPESPTATVAGDVLGTPTYMSLEQALGAGLDARSDVYAVGAMLYELLAGHAPYADKERSASDVLVAVVAGPPTPITKLKPKLPGEILAICEKAMARDPADRYQTAAELAQELRNFIEGRVVRTYRTGALVELKKWISRNKALAAAVAAAFALLLAGVLTNRSLYREAVDESERAQRQAYRAAIAAAASEIESHNLEAAEVRLDALPEDLRGWEWRHLRSRVDPSLARVPFRAVGFDGRGRVLGIDRSRALLAYDVETGEVTQVLENVVNQGNRRWVSADGRYCFVPLEGSHVGVWDLHAARVVLQTEEGQLDESRPWLHTDNGVLDIATGRAVPRDAADALADELMKVRVTVQDAAISPDRTRVALHRDNTLRIFDVATRAPVGDEITLQGNALCRAWSPDNSLLAIGSYGRDVVLVDTATGRARRKLYGHSGWVSSATFSADGSRLVTHGLDGSRVWDLGGDPEPHVLRGHHSYVYPVSFSPDGQRIVSGGWDGHVGETGSLRLWDAASGRPIVATSRIKTVWWAEFLPDGQRLLVAFRGKEGLRLLDADTLATVHEFGYLEQFAVSPDGTRVVGGYGKKCQVLDVATGEVLATLPREGGNSAVAYGRRWIATYAPETSRSLALWNARTLQRERVIPGVGDLGSVDFEPNGTRIVLAGGLRGSAFVYDAATGERLAELPGHGVEIIRVRFSPDGKRILVASRDTNIHIWDAESYEEIVQLRGHTSYVYSLAFSPDGETLASGSGDGTVRIWDTKPLVERQRAIAEYDRLAAELRPQVERLFGELDEPARVIARLRSELTGRRREVALQLALAETVKRRGG